MYKLDNKNNNNKDQNVSTIQELETIRPITLRHVEYCSFFVFSLHNVQKLQKRDEF